MVEFLILVDENDNEIGTMEKIEAHKKALLHRAFSGFIFRAASDRTYLNLIGKSLLEITKANELSAKFQTLLQNKPCAMGACSQSQACRQGEVCRRSGARCKENPSFFNLFDLRQRISIRLLIKNLNKTRLFCINCFLQKSSVRSSSNDKNELLLQRRDFKKYHNGGIWSNTVCSHPKPGEKTIDGVRRRIFEEFGFNSDFKEVGEFTYKRSFPNGLTEFEYDHIFVSKYQGQEINPNPEEICEYKWISRNDLKKEIEKNPEMYTFWLKKIIDLDFLNNYF